MLLLRQELGKDVGIVEGADINVVLNVSRAKRANDLILLDMDMPGLNCRQAIGDLAAWTMSVVLVLPAGGSGANVDDMAMEPAGFIPTCSGKIMRSALQLELSGGTYLPQAVLAGRSLPKLLPHPSSGGEKWGDVCSPLTRRQLDVLSRMAVGLSNKEIARALNLADETVKWHISAILKSLEANSRSQAVMIAWQSGILTGAYLASPKRELRGGDGNDRLGS